MEMKEIVLKNELSVVYPNTASMFFCSVCCQFTLELEKVYTGIWALDFLEIFFLDTVKLCFLGRW